MSGSGWILRVALAVVGAAVFVVLAWLSARRARSGDPEERAFGRMARWLGLGRGAREMVRELAKREKVAPVALLVCGDALRAAMGVHHGAGEAAAGEELRCKVLGAG